jgi:16S rRNA processing protein RimM
MLRVGGRDRELVRRSGTDERPILRLAGVQGREGVEALRGEELMVPRSAAPDLGEDEWWAEELEGCRVTDGDREVGVVVELLGLPSCEALRVERPEPGGGELLVPLVRDAVRSVDMRERRIDVNLAFLGEDEA